MLSKCESPDFMFPLYADIYYPMITQGSFNEIKKTWVFDRTVVCNATFLGGVRDTEIKPEIFLQLQNELIARTKSDLRISSTGDMYAVTNILVTNIRIPGGDTLYLETSGPRTGRGTIFEIGLLEPFMGPFRNVEYYKMTWRRTENQAVDN